MEISGRICSLGNVKEIRIMREYFKNHAGITMFLSTWVSYPIALYLFRYAYATLPTLSWFECFKIVTLITTFCSLVFFLLGWLVDCTNLAHLKRDFLRKLES